MKSYVPNGARRKNYVITPTKASRKQGMFYKVSVSGHADWVFPVNSRHRSMKHYNPKHVPVVIKSRGGL